MNARARIPMSFEEYLRWEEAQEEKHEYVRGRPVLRRLRSATTGTMRHVAIATNIVCELHERLRREPCHVLGSLLKVRSPTGNARYPDAHVDCGNPRPDDLVADEPTVIIEVLSLSNDEKEIRERLEDYQAIPSVAHVAFVEPKAPRARIWSRGQAGWALETVEGLEAVLNLHALSVVVPFTDVYEGVGLDAA